MSLTSDDIALERDIANLGMDRPEVTEPTVRRLAARGPAAVPALLAALAEDRLGGAGRGLVLRLLGRLALPETFPAVASAVRDPRYIAKLAALTAVASFDLPEATATLTSALSDPDPDIVREGAYLLLRRADSSAIPALVCLLEHPNPSCRVAAARALWALGGSEAQAALNLRRRSESDHDVLRALNGT